MESIKAQLKRYDIFRRTNAAVKASALRVQRARIRASYERRARVADVHYDPAAVPRRLTERLTARGIRPQSIPTHPGVLWVGADLQQDRGGFLQSLERHAQTTTFYRANNEYGILVKSADGEIRRGDPDVIRYNDDQLLRLVNDRLRNGPPLHVVMGQMWAHLVSVRALESVQQLGLVTINVAMDDRLPLHWQSFQGHLLGGAVGLKSGLDLILTTSPECCLWYEVEGALSQWWPLASDPAVFAPAPEAEKVHDISFVGSRYGVRDTLVQALLDAGVRVSAYGPGWPAGPIPADQVADVFARSKIILGIGTVAHTKSVYTLKLRDFDATMAGALYITHRNHDLEPLFEEGKEIEYYESASELVRKVKFYLANPERRAELARNGRARALRDHTWDTRLSELFAMLRGESVATRFSLPPGTPT